MSFKRFLILFIIFSTLAATGAGIWYWQRNTYSKEILKLEILGPDQADLAQPVEYLVKYKNNGTTRLEQPKLIFEYPKHSLVEGDRRKEIDLEEIYPGQEETLKFKARLLGKKDQAKIARAWLSYRPKNLKASYETKTTHTTVIEDVALTFEFELPSKIESGEVSMNLDYFSNVDYPLSQLRAMADYPSDFHFKEAEPEGLADNEWKIGLLNKAQGGKIKIKGKLNGEVGEEKIFKAKLGTWQHGEFVLLKEVTRGVQIVEPSLYISQQINGNPEYVASPGDSLHYEISFQNIGTQPLSDLFLRCRLEGKGFDFSSLKSFQGEFHSGDNSIIFDKEKTPKLRFLEAGEEGKVEFWIDLKEHWEPSPEQNPILKNKVYLSEAREEFVTKVSSELEITQKGYFKNEVFSNSGPIPPEVGETTTYVIRWQAKNYYNQIDNVKVKSELPPQVELTGKIFPEEEPKLAFDSKSREIVWNLGEMEVGAGVLSDAPKISFQIGFEPDASQRGKKPEIIKEVEITGEDSFTEKTLTATSSSITTALPDDDSVSEEDGIVQ